MSTFGFWNNKGGTGKTSLTFQTVNFYAQQHSGERILVIDLCPQANLSELFLGGLVGHGSNHLAGFHAQPQRQSVGGYFQSRLPTPFQTPVINPSDWIVTPNQINGAIPANIDLLAGDQILELQSNAMSSLLSPIPGVNTWLAVIDWISDFISSTSGIYNQVFIDMNPSFSIYTQIGLSSCERLIIPVMADDSSRRATQNIFTLIYGANLSPSSIYNNYAFSTRIVQGGRQLPKVHLIVKNRLTQYMGPASAYSSVLSAIDTDINTLLQSHPGSFTFTNIASAFAEVRDFQTTGVVSFAEGRPFTTVNVGHHDILGVDTQIRADYLANCVLAINGIVSRI